MSITSIGLLSEGDNQYSRVMKRGVYEFVHVYSVSLGDAYISYAPLCTKMTLSVIPIGEVLTSVWCRVQHILQF